MEDWTKEKVQEHARVAAAVELYTIPFYTTVMTSIIDENSEAYKIIRGVLIEEMVHLQLAANICLALDTTPNLDTPEYGKDIKYLKPYDPVTGDGSFLNAVMGPLDKKNLDEMLDIETPEEVQGAGDPTVNPYDTPDFPYSSIAEMYHALLAGIRKVGEDQFDWNAANQQQHWIDQVGYQQIIRNYGDAEKAVNAIAAQGEGNFQTKYVPPPYSTDKFKVEFEFQANNFPPSPLNPPYTPILYKEYSHYGRFLKIKNDGIPQVYPAVANPDHPLNNALEDLFRNILIDLNILWNTGGMTVVLPFGEINPVWMKAIASMQQTTRLARQCWKAGVIPYWGKPNQS